MFKILFSIILIFLLVIFQISFFSALSALSNFNLIVSLIIFITVIINYNYALWWAMGTGILLELYSVFNFGLIVFSLILTVVLVNILFDNFFTNRSLYSLAVLGFSGTLIYNFIFLFLTSLFYYLEFSQFLISFNLTYFYNLFWQLIFNLFLLALMFLVLNFISKKLKSVFLIN